MKTKRLVTVVREYLTPRLRRMLFHGWDMTKIADDCRGPVWEICLNEGVEASESQIVSSIIREANLLPQAEEWVEVPDKERLTVVPGTNSEWFVPHVSRHDNHTPSDVARRAGRSLSDVPWCIDEEINETLVEVLGLHDEEEREKRVPSRALDEIDTIGSSEFCVEHDTFDNADRIYANSAGTIASMWDKFSRTRNVLSEWRVTKLEAQEEYMEQLGLNQSKAAEILANPATYLFEGKCTLEQYQQCMSWHRIATTSKTNIPVFKDAASRGYADQLLMLRDPEVFIRALPFREDFIHAHWTLAQGLRSSMNALRSLQISDIVPLSKFTFTPCIYGAGQTGLYNSATGEQSPAGLVDDAGDMKVVSLPPLLDSLLGDETEEVRQEILYVLCGSFSKVFRRKIPKVQKFIKYWMAQWKEKASPEGLWIKRPDGSDILCPRMKRNKHETIPFSARWWEGKNRVEDSVHLYKTRMDDLGTAVSAFVAQNRDAFTMATAICLADGAIKAGIHDSAGYMLADERKVQRAYTRATNLAHRQDTMETGKKQLLIPEDESMLR